MNNLDVIPFEQQRILSNTKICIKGNNTTSDFLLANLLGLGIGEIYVIGDREDSSFFGDSDNEIRSYFHNLFSFSRVYFNKPETNVDFSVGVSEDSKNCDLYCSSDDSFLKVDGNSCSSTGSNLCMQGIVASVAADEIRKKFAPLKSIDTNESLIEYAPEFKKTFKSNKESNYMEVAVVGAGGIGNYCCFGLSNMGLNVKVFDFDLYEPRNKKRQILYSDKQNKAKRVEEFFNGSTKFTGIEEKIVSDNLHLLDDSEIVLSCVDNSDARKLLETYCLDRKIPLIDGGVSAVMGQVRVNQVAFTRSKSQRRSCAEQENPSVIVPNCIVGFQMANYLGVARPDIKYKFEFGTFNPRRFYENEN